MKVWFAILLGIALFWGGAGILVVKAFGAEEKCTSMCHMFQAYAIHKKCGAPLNGNYAKDRKWMGNKLSSLFEKRAMATWNNRTEELCNYECSSADEGTACYYLQDNPRRYPDGSPRI